MGLVYTDEERLDDIYEIVEARLNKDGLVVIDENLGDVAKVYSKIINIITAEKR